MSLHDAIEELLEAADGVVDGDALRAACAPLLRPHRTVVVGRVGVGKTTLCNRWTGGTAPTGLGGITLDVREIVLPHAIVTDTPGIDRPERALGVLDDVVGEADTLVWVVDGLQPLTASERHVVETVRPDGQSTVVLVARGDLLDATDASDVVHRVRAMTGAPTEALDLRHDALPEVPTGPSPRAFTAAAAALAALVATLPPAPLGAREAQQALRERVRALTDQLRLEVQQGRLVHKTEALAALHARGPAVLEGLPGPLPTPPAPDMALSARVLGGLSGREGAERLVRATAAGWLAEAQLALTEAYEAHPEWDEAARRRLRFDRSLERLRGVVSVLSG